MQVLEGLNRFLHSHVVTQGHPVGATQPWPFCCTSPAPTLSLKPPITLGAGVALFPQYHQKLISCVMQVCMCVCVCILFCTPNRVVALDPSTNL